MPSSPSPSSLSTNCGSKSDWGKVAAEQPPTGGGNNSRWKGLFPFSSDYPLCSTFHSPQIINNQVFHNQNILHCHAGEMHLDPWWRSWTRGFRCGPDCSPGNCKATVRTQQQKFKKFRLSSRQLPIIYSLLPLFLHQAMGARIDFEEMFFSEVFLICFLKTQHMRAFQINHHASRSIEDVLASVKKNRVCLKVHLLGFGEKKLTTSSVDAIAISQFETLTHSVHLPLPTWQG